MVENGKIKAVKPTRETNLPGDDLNDIYVVGPNGEAVNVVDLPRRERPRLERPEKPSGPAADENVPFPG